MHELEPISYCSIEEYFRFLEKRVRAEEITVGGLYLVLADIRRRPDEKPAFKFPIRAKHIKAYSPKDSIITSDILNLDLQPTIETHFSMAEGLVKRPNLIVPDTQQVIREMYLKDYEDFGPLGPSHTFVEDEVDIRELASV